MDRVSYFKLGGDLSLTVPLTQGFDRILHDFIQMVVSKSRFESDESGRIAARVSNLVREKIRGAQKTGKTGHAEISMTHGQGHIRIKTTIQELGFEKEEKFQSRAS